METQVVMKRELFGMPISQQSKTEFFSATDLVRAGNKWRRLNDLSDFNISTWLKKESTVEFMDELGAKFGKIIIKGRGRGKNTWMHPLLFIDLALAISPKLKIEVYEWLFDHLIKNRNESGDSYKLMCGSLYVRQSNKQAFQKYIADLAIKIKYKCKVADWQEATECQLNLRNKVHTEIALLSEVLNDNDEAIRIALSRVKDHQ